ncbi:MAG: 6-carboxytetrahydropterin synthase [Saprospiraceae bacterium]|nr:6-carboxytetrahydropterin synthase [Saprospiraceae bacterium]
MRISIIRRGHFNSAHMLRVDSWSEEKNREVFGPCANPNFHGHNYEIELKVTGEVDPVTGMVIDLRTLKQIIKEEVEDRFDHKNLNVDCPEFEDLMPSAENLCYVIHQLISKRLGDEYDVAIKLYETPRNFVEYPA